MAYYLKLSSADNCSVYYSDSLNGTWKTLPTTNEVEIGTKEQTKYLKVVPNNGYSVNTVKKTTGSSGTISWVQNDEDTKYYQVHWTGAAANCSIVATTTAKKYTVTIKAGDGGSVSPSGEQSWTYNTKHTITAIADSGYYFSYWTGGSTTNPREIRVTGTATYTAIFAGNSYKVSFDGNGGSTPSYISVTYGSTYGTLPTSTWYGHSFQGWWLNSTKITSESKVNTVGNHTLKASWTTNNYTIYTAANPSAGGSVSGGGTGTFNTTKTLTATANEGYEFDQWQDGNTTNPRTVKILGDATYTASFSKKNWTVKATIGEGAGSVTGSGVYAHGDSCTLTASPSYGYHFLKWSDGNTSNPRTFTVTGNVTLTVTLEKNSYTITAVPNSASLGSVTGGGTYPYGSSVTLTATHKTNCHFVKWQDNNTTNPRTITVSADATYTATFALDTYQINIQSGGNGTVSPASNTYSYGTELTLVATPNTGYHFVQWSDGLAQTHKVTVHGTATYTATFAIDTYTISYNNNGGSGTIASQTKNYGATISLSNGSSFSKDGYTLYCWNTKTDSSGQDYPLGNPYSSNSNLNLFASWGGKITLLVDPIGAGTVSGSGTLRTGMHTTPIATPLGEYSFVRWSDGETTATHSQITVDGDKTLTAYFSLGHTVTFNDNGGTGGPGTRTKFVGVALEIPTTYIPIKSGQVFLCWNTIQTGTGITYLPGDQYTEEADMTLYAQWGSNFTWTDSDDTNIIPGQLVNQLTAVKWNILATTIEQCYQLYIGRSTTLPRVSENERIEAGDFNLMVQALATLQARRAQHTMCSQVNSGDIIKAIYFNGVDENNKYSLKNGINSVIHNN